MPTGSEVSKTEYLMGYILVNSDAPIEMNQYSNIPILRENVYRYPNRTIGEGRCFTIATTICRGGFKKLAMGVVNNTGTQFYNSARGSMHWRGLSL